MNKKWHENIPENGVLCKEKSSGSIVRITEKSCSIKLVIDDRSKRHVYDPDELTPLTAAEWWDFAPWQDMKDAPLFVDIMVHKNNGKVFSARLVAEFERDNYKKWLPLPQVSK
jgi:hypothetical protein